jgi:1-acyl-sn-glycerol-3-phosphate acyltransferase
MLRSIAFAIAFNALTAVMLLGYSYRLLGTRERAMAALKQHARAALWLQRKIVGTKFEVRGHDNLLQGPVLVAAKHQSAWDTFALIPQLSDPALIMKRELLWIPFYGWFSAKLEMIFVNREAGPKALRQMVRDAKARADDGREIVIFPEGTRRAPGAAPDYKPGAFLLYDQLKVPCIPVALNSGLFWPRRSVMRYPGTIVVEFLEPIPPGLNRAEFSQRLQDVIERASDRLLAEAAAAPNAPPLPDVAQDRLEAIAAG